MTNPTATIKTATGNSVTISTADSRVKEIYPAMKACICRSMTAAAEVQSSLAAWGLKTHREAATLTWI